MRIIRFKKAFMQNYIKKAFKIKLASGISG